MLAEKVGTGACCSALSTSSAIAWLCWVRLLLCRPKSSQAQPEVSEVRARARPRAQAGKVRGQRQESNRTHHQRGFLQKPSHNT